MIPIGMARRTLINFLWDWQGGKSAIVILETASVRKLTFEFWALDLATTGKQLNLASEHE